jgi:hypothetical protein
MAKQTKKDKTTKKLNKAENKDFRKAVKIAKKSAKAGKRAAKLFGKFYRVSSKLDDIGLSVMEERIAKKNKCKISVTPITKRIPKKKVTKKAV